MLSLPVVLILVMVSVAVYGATYTVTITVNENEVPISGAIVEVYDTNNTLVANGTTDANGTVSLNLTDGNYTVKIVYNNKTYTYNITVDANHTSFSFDIGMSNITVTTPATNTTGITDKIKDWWNSLSTIQRIAVIIGGLIVLLIILKR